MLIGSLLLCYDYFVEGFSVYLFILHKAFSVDDSSKHVLYNLVLYYVFCYSHSFSIFVLIQEGINIFCFEAMQANFEMVSAAYEFIMFDLCLISENGEDIQVLRYEPGQKYDPHFDYFTDKVNIARGGHRIATVLMYLTDVAKGGETVFPSAEVSSSCPFHMVELQFIKHTLQSLANPSLQYLWSNILRKSVHLALHAYRSRVNLC